MASRWTKKRHNTLVAESTLFGKVDMIDSINNVCVETEIDCNEAELLKFEEALLLPYKDILENFELSDATESDSPTSSSSNYVMDFNLHIFLKDWAITERISQSSLKALLAGLQNIDPSLPKDPRTLLQTSQNIIFKEVSPGQYYHFGIIKSLEYILKFVDFQTVSSKLRLQINVDGLPLFNSTTKGFWPILGKVSEIKNSVFLIGLYYGANKPLSAADFLADTIDELKHLECFPLTVLGRNFSVELTAICCDTPARYFIKCIKSYNGYFGCDRCQQKGTHPSGHVFLDSNALERTDVSFRAKEQPQHHHSKSPFECIKVDMIHGFPADYMHCVCKGVGLRLLNNLRSGPIPNRLSGSQLAKLDEELENIAQYLPSDFSRRPRSLQHLGHWKATEVRLFILYLGPALFKHILGESQINLLKACMCFSVSIFILCNPSLNTLWNERAKELITTFIEQCRFLYGDQVVTYNMHSLLHLCQDCSRIGPCDLFSCFPFENFLRFVKMTVKANVLPLNQAVKRVYESDVCLGQLKKFDSSRSELNLLKKQENGVLPNGFDTSTEISYYGGISFASFYLINNQRDCFFMLQDKVICKLLNVVQKTNNIYLVFHRYLQKEDYFTYPCSSSELGIFCINQLQKKAVICSPKAVLCKMCVFQTHGKTFASPVLHTTAADS